MKTMISSGYFLEKFGNAFKAFSLKDFTLEAPSEHEVVIKVEAFGLNYADVMARKGLYRETPQLPCIIGYEVVGTIIEVGSNVSTEKIGQRVVAFTRFGGYAKHVKTVASAAVAINDMPSEIALALSTQFVTAFYMSDYISTIYPGNIVLIHAVAGGVGNALIQFCKSKGAIVIAKIGDESKKELVKQLGADYIVNYTNEDYEIAIKRFLGDRKLTISFNPAGGSTFKKDMRLLGAGGKLISYGGAELSNGKWGILSQLNFMRKMGIVLPIALMIQSKSIIGVNMLKVGDQSPEILSHCLSSVVKLTQSGQIKPQVGGIFEADFLAEAHQLLASGKTTGKISITW